MIFDDNDAPPPAPAPCACGALGGTCGCCEGLGVQTPLEIYNRPGLSAIGYRIGTQPLFKRTMLDRLSPERKAGDPPSPLSGLAARGDTDMSIALLDAWAVVSDVVTFYQERIANESYVRTATESRSLTQLGRLVGYEPRSGVAATTFLAFSLNQPPLIPSIGVPGLPAMPASLVAIGGPAGLTVSTLDVGIKIQSVPGPGEQAQTFETVESIAVRADWNQLRPRLTQPHPVDSRLDRLVFNGLDSRLKAGDYLLMMHGASKNVRQILEVRADNALQTTSVTLEPGDSPPPSWPDPSAVVIPNGFPEETLRPLNDQTVTDLIVNTGAVWRQEDVVAFALIQKWPIDDLEVAINRVVDGRWNGPAVIAFRGRAPLFGHNAPKWASLPDILTHDQVYFRRDGNGKSIGFELVPAAYKAPGWDNPLASAMTPWIDLDNVYPAIAPKSWVVLMTPGNAPNSRFPVRVQSTQELTRADFTISAKVTRLGLADNGTTFTLRDTTALFQSEALTLGRLPVSGSLARQGVVLARAELSLKSGQKIILTGQRADASGVTGSELLTIASASLVGGFTVLKFERELAYSYILESVTINANVALATHGETVREVLGSGDASQTFQRFRLKQPPLTYVPTTGAGGAESTLEVRVNDVLWHRTPTLYGRGPHDQIYVLRARSGGDTTVEFGDGVTGARLPSGQDNVRALYRKGLGAAGSVKAGSLSSLLTRPPGVKDATNPLAATGGDDPESVESARRNLAVTILTLDRIVSLQDFEDFARAFTGVAKAMATWTWDGQRRGVMVTIAGPGGAVADAAFLSRLRSAMRAAGDPSVSIRLTSYRPSPFKLAARVECDPDYLPAKVAADVESALRAAYAFDTREFGQAVLTSEVITIIQNVQGVTDLNLSNLYLSTINPPILGDLVPDTPRAGVFTGGTGPVLGAQLLTLDPAPLSGVIVKSTG